MHNITSFSVTDRPGTESYDPVLLGGKSVRGRLPCTPTRARTRTHARDKRL